MVGNLKLSARATRGRATLAVRILGRISLPLIVLAATLCVLPARVLALEEEFVGPFASWLDVRRDFGAIGDGKADDTLALQRALDELRPHQRACVLYLPAGTYRLTQTLKTVRQAHQDNMVTIVGEDPSRTVLQWDGPSGGTMMEWDAWYAKLSRLTFDGRGRAGTCLLYGPSFSTYNETSDLVFRDAKSGIVFGTPDSAGQAENEVLRCQFSRCEVGIQTVNWNSMDIWVWYCRFEDCGRGIHNVMGNWHAWQNLFLRSRISDVSLENLMAFSVVNNTSIGSRCFLDFSTGHSWGSPTSITGNRVLDATGEWAIRLDNAGPYLVVDNTFRLGEKTRAIRMTWADQTLVGNVYSTENAVEERGRFRRIGEQIVGNEEVADAVVALPAAPPHRKRPVFDLPDTSDTQAIQRAIDQAAALAGQRPVVHLPMGAYSIDRTLVIPVGCDLQLVGDGASEIATRLVWTGPAEGVVLKIEGPNCATIRDLQVQGNEATAVLVEWPDQSGSRMFADQLNTNGPASVDDRPAAALRVAGFEHSKSEFRALQGSGNEGKWVEVIGPEDNDRSGSIVTVFTGATGTSNGQYDVRDQGRLVVRGVYHERSSAALNGLHLTDCGTLSIDATRFSYATSETSPTVAVDGFRGIFTLATCMLMPVETQETCRFELRGDGSQTSVLALNNQFWVQKPGTTADSVWRDQTEPSAAGGLIGCNLNTSNKEVSPRGFEFLEDRGDEEDPAKSPAGSGPFEDRGEVADGTILHHLAPLRAAKPWLPSDANAGHGELCLHRLIASSRRGTTVEIRARKPNDRHGSDRDPATR